ncbi:MAG: OmpA family protein [Acidobacteria bacterium]|nr:OmpA family protein [Acidobacteriota bacterium]
MKRQSSKWIILICTLLLIASGCKKKTPPPPPPPPPPVKAAVEAAKPVARIEFFQVEPSSIQRGQSATLNWKVMGADSVSIEPGIGTVPAQGSRQVYPSDSTTYTLSARAAGSNDSRTARVTVTEPPASTAPPPSQQAKDEPLVQMLERLVSDSFYDYDKYDVREDARSTLTRNADALKQIFAKYPNAVITVEGHCDERGSAEYNLGLGDRRSAAARDFLVQLGVPADKLKTISYGKERQQCTDATEGCYQKNRRAHFTAAQ